jgi:transcriptional regulator with XRE-family HTH domain
MTKEEQQFYKLVGIEISAHREALRLSQDDLAMMTGLSRASIANIEVGRQSVLLHRLYKIAQALRCDPENLLPTISKPAAKTRELGRPRFSHGRQC